MGIFDSKTFLVTFTADLVVLLVLFVLCMIVIAGLIYNPFNKAQEYKRRQERNMYFDGAASYHGAPLTVSETPRRYPPTSNTNTATQANTFGSENPFYQDVDDSIAGTSSFRNTYNQQTGQQQGKNSNKSTQIGGGNANLNIHGQPSQNDPDSIPLEPITLAVEPSVSK